LAGRIVGLMIRRSVRKRFHTVYWRPPSFKLEAPVLFVPNHHGWFDGYLMFHAVTELGIPTLDWIQEFDSFPLFAKIGGMPYPLEDPKRRAATVKRTIRLMRERGWSLLMFAESHLHYPPNLLPFGKAIETIAEKVNGVQVVPVGIRYEMAMHERPEAFLAFGTPVTAGPGLPERTREAVASVLEEIDLAVRGSRDGFEVLAAGTPDVNERWDAIRRRR
jgi:1-acyl-sn-glycerol-3-phosphate acyltransferase